MQAVSVARVANVMLSSGFPRHPEKSGRLHDFRVTLVHFGETEGHQRTHDKETDMTSTDTPLLNGVNVEALLGARQALTDAPEAAKFQWRAKSEWVNGTHSKTTIDGF